MQFQGLLSMKDDAISGPMSPVLFIKETVQQMGFRITGLARLLNCPGNYDYLITKTHYEKYNLYWLFIDMGNAGIPVGFWFTDDPIASLTPVYKKNLTEEAQDRHRRDCEIFSKHVLPIMAFTEEELKTLFQDAENEHAFDIK